MLQIFFFNHIMVPIEKDRAQCLWIPVFPPLLLLYWLLFIYTKEFQSVLRKTKEDTMQFSLNFPVTYRYNHSMLMPETPALFISNLFLSNLILLAILRDIFFRIFELVFLYIFRLLTPNLGTEIILYLWVSLFPY